MNNMTDVILGLVVISGNLLDRGLYTTRCLNRCENRPYILNTHDTVSCLIFKDAEKITKGFPHCVISS